MVRKEIKLIAQIGEYMEDVTLVEWKKNVGDEVNKGDIVAVCETAKVNVEVESPYEGILDSLLVDVDDDCRIGETLAYINVDG